MTEEWPCILPGPPWFSSYPRSLCLPVVSAGQSKRECTSPRGVLSPPLALQPCCHCGSRNLPDVCYWCRLVRVTALSADRSGGVGCAWVSPNLLSPLPALAALPLPHPSLPLWACLSICWDCRSGCHTGLQCRLSGGGYRWESAMHAALPDVGLSQHGQWTHRVGQFILLKVMVDHMAWVGFQVSQITGSVTEEESW